MVHRIPVSFVVRLTTFFGSLLTATAATAGEITQHFPANEPPANMRTQWRVVWGVEKHATGSEVLFIKEAFFKRTPSDPEIKVLGDCRLADIFVPYNNGTRIYDISGFDFQLVTLDKNALGPPCITPGAIFDRQGDRSETGPVAAEVHDGHIRWMNADEKIRRGQSLALWAVLDGANYRYVMLYQFRDDGVVGLRLGATAHNLNNTDADGATHLHMGCWRINVDLGDPARTKVSKVTLDTTALATVAQDLDKEERIKWVPEEFTRLRVSSTSAMNAHNPAHPISYELIPVRMGSGRYHGVGEEFTLHDLWVTRRRDTPLEELQPHRLNVVANGETIDQQQTTLWHHAPVLHVGRDEDFGVNGTNRFEGVAINTWAGCDLKPRNFFASTPLYP